MEKVVRMHGARSIDDAEDDPIFEGEGDDELGYVEDTFDPMEILSIVDAETGENI